MAEILRGFQWLYNTDGSQQMVLNLPVKISQTLYRGNVVNLSYTSGSIRVAAEGETALYGVILHSKSTTATQVTARADVVPFTVNAVFQVKGAPSTMTTLSEKFRAYPADLEIPTTGYHRVDTGAATLHFRIVGWPNSTSDASGAGRKWHVTIMPTAAAFQGTRNIAT